MSTSILNFVDNLSIPINKYLKWITQSTTANIIGIDSSNNLNLNSGGGDMYINSNNGGSNTFFNVSNNSNVLINSKLAVGISNTSNLNANISLPINSFIGINTTQGNHNGYLGLAGSSSLDNTTGSRLLLYGINGSSPGSINMYTGNNTSGNINLFTGNDSLKVQILNSGVVNFQPDNIIRLSISDNTTTITNPLLITNTTPSTNYNTGALQVAGGVSVQGDTYINGTLSINSLVGNLNFNNTTVSTSYSSGTLYLSGGIGIECSSPAINQYNGGGMSNAGGLALGQNAMIGGNITIFNSNVSNSAISGSGIFYGGVGINGQVNIRTGYSSQIKLIPVVSGNETSIFFGSENNYGTTGSWTMGQNVYNINSDNFGIGSANNNVYIELTDNNTIILNKYTKLLNTLEFNNNVNSIIFNNTSGNSEWSVGNDNGYFQISRFTQGNLIDYLLTADTKTGNITIYGTQNSTSSTNGGSLTINGGAGIMNDLYLGGNLYGENINFTGALIQNPASSSPNSFSYITLTATDNSINYSSGSFLTFGGITILGDNDSVSVTNGGGLTIAGGASIKKSLIVGNTINSTTISTNNAIIVNSTISNLNLQNVNSTNLTNSNLSNINITNTNLINTNLSSSSATIDNLINTSFTSTNVNVVNSTTTNFVSVLSNISNASIINITSSSAKIVNITSTNASLTNINSTNITNNNLVVTNITVSNGLVSAFNTNTLGNIFTTGGNIGINTISPSVTLDINGTVYARGFIGIGTSSPTNSLDVIGNIVANGNIGVGTTSPSFNLDVIGTANISTSITTNSIYSNNTFNINGVITNFTNTNLNTDNITTTSVLSTNITSTNLYSTNLSSTNIKTNVVSSSNVIVSNTFNGMFNSNTLGNIFTTGGNIGINNVSPSVQLDITGVTKISGSLIASFNSNTIGSIIITGGNIGVKNTVPHQILELSPITYSNNQDGGLRIGTSDYVSDTDSSYRYIDLRLVSDNSLNFNAQIIGTLSGGIPSEYSYMSFNQAGTVTFFSSDILNPSVYMNGGLSITFDVNATGTTFGGSLTVIGGAAISNDVFIGGDLTVTGSILYENAAQASSTFAYLTLTATDQSVNLSTGALITNGGITILSNANATSVTSGGGLTVVGGIACNSDIYVGGKSNLPNVIVTNETVNNLIVTNGLKAIFNSNTIGNIFTTGGNIGIGTNSPTKLLTISGIGNPICISTGSTSSGSYQSFVTGNSEALLGIDGYNFAGFDTGAFVVSTNTNNPIIFGTNQLQRMIINTAGNIGINNSNPLFPLDIYGQVNIGITNGSLNSTTGSLICYGGISISKTSNATSTTCGGALTVNGGVAILKDVYVGGTVTSSSDIKLKQNLKPLKNTLNLIENIRTITYNSIDENDKKDYIGFIAQDFESDFPELLSRQNSNANYSLDYSRVTVLLMKCIKELKQEITKLKSF